jgi:hypothetical protein
VRVDRDRDASSLAGSLQLLERCIDSGNRNSDRPDRIGRIRVTVLWESNDDLGGLPWVDFDPSRLTPERQIPPPITSDRLHAEESTLSEMSTGPVPFALPKKQ